MALKIGPCNLGTSSASYMHLADREACARCLYREVAGAEKGFYYHAALKQKFRVRKGLFEYRRRTARWTSLELGRHGLQFRKFRRTLPFVGLGSTNDGVTVNGTPQASSSSELQEIRVKLDQSVQGEDLGGGMVQSLHDAARAIELAILDHSSSSRTSWFSKAWLGVDRNAWVKTFSYQVAVFSLLQAAVEISSRGDGRDRDLNIFVQRSIIRLYTPLENVIREELSAKQPAAFDWFWSQQQPMVVTSFVNIFESNPRFSAATEVSGNGPSNFESTSVLSLLLLSLYCIAAVTKLGPAKVSCTQFFSTIPDISGRLMDMLADYAPIQDAYHLVKEIGLRREFLLHFGTRAAACRVHNDQDIEEIAFWVELVQKQLQQAIDRERIWSRLTTCESIEVLEKDLAIFGYFIALGRSTQLFLTQNGHSVPDYLIESIVRYFIGGSVLFYPQLSSISSYQLYVEVVCEELEWLPFYGTKLVTAKLSHGSKSQVEGLPYGEVVSQILDVCSHWTKSFIKYSLWLENPSNIKAARFLSKCHSKLSECRKELSAVKNNSRETTAESESEMIRYGSNRFSTIQKELGDFDKALESVEEAIIRLEELLQELHLSNTSNGKEHLKAACSDLEKIRKLKKEAEFLEASFRAKAASLEEGNDEGDSQSVDKQKQYLKRKNDIDFSTEENRNSVDRLVNKPRGLWSFLAHHSTGKTGPELTVAKQKDSEFPQQDSSFSNSDRNSNIIEIHRFEVLRRELIELEQRVQRSNDEYQIDEDPGTLDNDSVVSTSCQKLVPASKANIISKSIDKLKETGTDVWQGTQLLAIDVAAATVLIKRALTGDELAEKEKNALRRTLTDVASVVPIGILMLLPVTAVGHAAMLAAIQRYVPALIPSTYAPERLSLLRQIEKVKEIESSEMKPDEDEPQSV